MEFVGARPKKTAVAGGDSEAAWPPGLTRPALPRFPRSLSSNRFRATDQPRFGDDQNIEDTRPLPNLVFSNGHARYGCHLSPRLQLPDTIHFFVHVKFQRVSFPFPPGISTKQFLHAAPLRSSEGDFAAATLPFDERHVIGLCRHHCSGTFAQLVIVVPSTPTVNPRLQPTKLSFHPRHSTQLHRGVEGGAERSDALPRLVVPVWPVLVSRGAARGRDKRMPAFCLPPRWGTFGTSDGRMGPAFLPASSGPLPSRAAAIAAAEEFLARRNGEKSSSSNRCVEPRRPSEPREHAQQPRAQVVEHTRAVNDNNERVIRPSFLLA